MSHLPTPICEFRIYPGSKHGVYWTVRIFRTLKEMRRFASRTSRDVPDAYGVCQNYRAYCVKSNGQMRLSRKEWGHILMAKQHLGTRIIVHECVHAAIQWCDWKGINPMNSTPPWASKAEELACTATENLVANLVDALYHRKLL